MLTKKGLKMSISKCFNNYQIEKSKSVVTEVRGQHEQMNGYLFEDDLENNRVILKWHNDDLTIDEKLTKIKELYNILDRHGFGDYMILDDQEAKIYLIKFI